VFNNSSADELRYFFRSDDSLAQPLSDLRGKGPAASADELQKWLGKAGLDKLAEEFGKLSPLQRQYLVAPSAEKKDIQKAPHPASLPPGKEAGTVK